MYISKSPPTSSNLHRVGSVIEILLLQKTPFYYPRRLHFNTPEDSILLPQKTPFYYPRRLHFTTPEDSILLPQKTPFYYSRRLHFTIPEDSILLSQKTPMFQYTSMPNIFLIMQLVRIICYVSRRWFHQASALVAL